MSTTCNNFECPEYKTCNFNIHNGGKKPCPKDQHYMSSKQRIWADYTRKCEENGTEPMPYNIYFEH